VKVGVGVGVGVGEGWGGGEGARIDVSYCRSLAFSPTPLISSQLISPAKTFAYLSFLPTISLYPGKSFGTAVP